jgi:hypothetical protein
MIIIIIIIITSLLPGLNESPTHAVLPRPMTDVDRDSDKERRRKVGR